jgi:hypothetical protein
MNNDEQKMKLGLGDDIPMIDASSNDFMEQLKFNIWSEQSNSDYSNDRKRPYNGQYHTDDGIRGKTLVEGLTFRDIKDCLIKAMLISSHSKKYLDEDYFKCWDFSTDPPTPTQYLLDHQNESDFISTKVELETWRPQDVYKINWNDIDPLAISRNLSCEIEKMMGIFPNIPNIKYEDGNV